MPWKQSTKGVDIWVATLADMWMHYGMNTAIHIAQIACNKEINVRTGPSLAYAAYATLKERASKLARRDR